MERAVEKLLAAAEQLIAELDAVDGDADEEPELGATLAIDQRHWTEGADSEDDDPAEDDDAAEHDDPPEEDDPAGGDINDEPHDGDVDDEPSLGWSETASVRGWITRECSVDASYDAEIDLAFGETKMVRLTRTQLEANRAARETARRMADRVMGRPARDPTTVTIIGPGIAFMPDTRPRRLSTAKCGPFGLPLCGTIDCHR